MLKNFEFKIFPTANHALLSARLGELNTALGPQLARLARTGRSRKVFRENPRGQFTVVGKSWKHFGKIQQVLERHGFAKKHGISVTLKSGEKTRVRTRFQLASWIG